jgi:hypothetical protein
VKVSIDDILSSLSSNQNVLSFLSFFVQYFTFVIVLAFCLLVIGGFCFILTNSSVDYLQTNWDKLYAMMPASQRATTTLSDTVEKTKAAMYGIGGGCLILFFECVGALNYAIGLMTASRAFTLFLQATNISMLPIGVALIAAAAYVADTAVSAETTIAAFAIFILGIFVIALVLLGCVGTSLQSRGVVKLFMFLTFLLSFAFISFGVLALVQADLVSQLITSQWDVIRKALPPTFTGKYDKEAFQAFIDANLTSLGFLSVVAALLLVSQTWASMRLRAELKFESEAEQEAWEAVREGLLPKSVAEELSRENAKSKAQIMWKQQWTKGTRRSRILIMVCCGCLTFFVALAIALAATAVYYSTSCVSLGKYSETMAYQNTNSNGQLSTGASSMAIQPHLTLTNYYTLGSITIRLDTSLKTAEPRLSYRKQAFRQDMSTSSWPALTNATVAYRGGVVGAVDSTRYYNITSSKLEGSDAGPTNLLGYDISCQNSDVFVTYPPFSYYKTHPTFTDASAVLQTQYTPATQHSVGAVLDLKSGMGARSGTTGITIDTYNNAGPTGGTIIAADKVPLLYGKLATSSGAILVDGALIRREGLSASTSTGEVVLSRSDAVCSDNGDPNSGQVAGTISLTTDKGVIMVDGLTSRNCEVALTGNAALTSVTNTVIRSDYGGARLTINGQAGIMAVSSSVVQDMILQGSGGSVRLTNLTVSDALRISAGSGSVLGRELSFGRGAAVQVESDTGSIDIRAKAFKGIISIITSGPINCPNPQGKDTKGNPTSGFMTLEPCKKTTTASSSSSSSSTSSNAMTVVDNIQVNCQPQDCPYLGTMTITSMRGAVTLQMDWTA